MADCPARSLESGDNASAKRGSGNISVFHWTGYFVLFLFAPRQYAPPHTTQKPALVSGGMSDPADKQNFFSFHDFGNGNRPV